ncbi:Acyl-coenzyme A:6-aminopenicillanic acid acyl-transferase [uncultured archaeon]|nr:Acyl-coenzyme A:6-aminopenicillanic acid acyl-transferase [uncultured archaeon]
MKKIPLIEACGSNYEIGFAIGQKLKKQIRELIKIERKDYPAESGKPLPYYVKKMNTIVGIPEKYFPHYVEELLGMAEGSGIDFNTIVALGCDDDLVFNCTSIAGLSKEGMILGHNEDWLRDHINSLYICRIEQKDKPDSMSLSFIGHLPGLSIGFNSEGCAYTENSIYTKGINRKDLPMQFLVRAHLDAKKYSDLTRIFSIRDKMIGGNSLIAFKGKIFDVEFLPKGYATIHGHEYLAHTNHVLSRRIMSEEKHHSRGSVWRLDRANELLKNNDFSFDLVKKILSDHVHRPFSICYHEFEKKGAEPYSTIASAIAKVDKKEFYVAHGNPCEAKYNKYYL